MSLDRELLEQRYLAVRSRVPKDACLIAVSKTQGPDAIEALYRLGQRDFGENYAQELLEKAPILNARGCVEIRWHFIGHLQTNKVKALIPWVHSVHAVDSERLAVELSKRWLASGREGQLPVLLEVNVDLEPSKSGVAPSEVGAIADQIRKLPGVKLVGLMCIPSQDASAPKDRVSPFRRLSDLGKAHAIGPRLSMGMTHDFEDALLEGATDVRIGTAIFGPRS